LDVQTIAQALIGASHTLPLEPGCDRLHGHTYLVTAAAEGPFEPKTGHAVGGKGIKEHLEALLVELDRKDLDTMMPGGITTPEGIAAWLVERLSQKVERLIWIEVQEMDTKRAGRALRKLR